MAKRSRIRQKRLEEVESEFRSLLVASLRECANGQWGLFGHNDHLDPEEWSLLRSPASDRLKEMAYEIRALRAEFGEHNETCEKFLALCSLRGPNVRGEPKLAAAFLAGIGEN